MSHFATPVELLQTIFRVIDELRPLNATEADRLTTMVSSKPIGEITADDLQMACTLLEQHRSVLEGMQPRCYIARDYSPFIDAIPQGRRLLDDIENLALSHNLDALIGGAERIFIERLGYTKARLNETARTARVEFAHIELIGHFGELDVVCVLLSRPNRYAQFYDTIFRFHPYALIISLEPNARAIRFVYRQGPSKQPRYRCLTGPQAHWEPNDNLLVWAWRLHQMRPHLGESAQTLQRRVSRALALSPEDIGSDWPSVAIDPNAPLPGVTWEQASRRAFESFLQLNSAPEERRRWGLDAVLRDRFPIEVARGAAQVEYIGYTVGEEPPPVEECIRSGANRDRAVIIDIRLCCGEERRHAQLRGTLPEPDDMGYFIFEGHRYRFTAQVRDDGRLAALSEEVYDWSEEEDEQDESELVEEMEAPTDESMLPDSEGKQDQPIGEQLLRDFRGLSPRAFYEFAVSRKLAGLAYMLWRLPLKPEASVTEQLLHRIRRFGRRLDHVPLAAWSVLRRFLARHEGAAFIRAEDWRVASSPPSWCCLDHSASLRSGLFVPVAGARMHPTGSLALPIQTEAAIRLSLSEMPATDINPRANGKPIAGSSDWWISADLAGLGTTRAGAPAAPELFAISHPIEARVATTRGSEPKAWVKAGIPLPQRQSHWVERRVPVKGNVCPKLLVGPGSRVVPGAPWLRVDPACWSTTKLWQESSEERLALAILEYCDDSEVEQRVLRDDPRWLERIPPGIRGVVVSVSLTPSTSPFGREYSWIARIEVQPPNDMNGVLIGPHGSVYPVAGPQHPCELPFDADGWPVDVLVEEPSYVAEPGAVLIAGDTGEAISASLAPHGWRFAHYPQPAPATSDRYLRVRTVDGEGLPAHTCSPSLTERDRLRWLILESGTAQPLVQAAAREGYPCWTPQFQRAAEAAGIHLTAELNPAPSPAPIEGEIHDPVITKLHRRLKAPKAGMALYLPIPIIHPWHKSATAAVLGLTTSELDRLINRHGLGTVVAAVRGALKDKPYDAALRRIREESKQQTRASIGEALLRLQRIPLDALEAHLLLTALPIPSPSLLPVGFPPGSSRALRTPMLRRYRAIAFAIEMVKQFSNGPAVAREIAEVELQRSVEELFGPRQGAPTNGHTIAGWLNRLYPLTRSPTARMATVNLCTVSTSSGPTPALVNGEAIVTPPTAAQSRRPAELNWWRERAARAHLTGPRLTWFLGLFAALDLPQSQRPRIDVASPDGPLGEWMAREWLRRLEHAEARPFRLAQLLESKIPSQLPAAPEGAVESLNPILQEAFPGFDETGLRLRRVFTQILTGFWMTTVSQDAPTGWLWCAPDETPPVKARRYVPPFESPAWLLWPYHESATSAPQLALDIYLGQPMPSLLRALAGFPHETKLEAPELIASCGHMPEPVSETPHLPETPEVIPLAPLSSSPLPSYSVASEITISAIGLRRWLQATRPHLPAAP